MGIIDFFHGLEFDDDLGVDHEINAVHANSHAVVTNAHRELPLVRNGLPIELKRKSLFIHGLQKARSEFLMYVDGTNNYSICERAAEVLCGFRFGPRRQESFEKGRVLLHGR